MRYRVTQPFIAFGKAPSVGDIVELTEEQAKTLTDMESVADYETKVLPPPGNKAKKKAKPSASSRPVRAQRKKIPKRSRKSAKK